MVFVFERWSLRNWGMPEELVLAVVRRGNGETGLFQRSMKIQYKIKQTFSRMQIMAVKKWKYFQ